MVFLADSLSLVILNRLHTYYSDEFNLERPIYWVFCCPDNTQLDQASFSVAKTLIVNRYSY
jgi:hypothetical protein